jgi:hypothetical protein
MDNNRERTPDEPKRFQAFAHFFKRYMNLSSVAAAVLPIPVTSFNLIPTFKVQTTTLSTYTSMFCFLILGFLFYSRHRLARRMFPYYLVHRYATEGGEVKTYPYRRGAWFVDMLPLCLILASVGCLFYYHALLNSELVQIGKLPPMAGLTSEEILKLADARMIELAPLLMVVYLGIFVCAEAAFILMAIKEYLQDWIGISEMDLIKELPERVKNA